MIADGQPHARSCDCRARATWSVARSPRLWLHTMRNGQRLITLLLTALAFVLACVEVQDTDLWWHIRSGQWILTQHRVPQLDPFTFASGDRPWIDVQWGFDVVAAIAYGLGGVGALVLLTAAVSSAAFFLILTARRADGPSWLVNLCWLVALFTVSARFTPRPETLSFLYIAAFLAILLRSERQPALLWLIPPLQVLWANTHALSILGPFLLGCGLFDRASVVDANRGLNHPGGVETDLKRRRRVLVWVTVFSLLACLATPYGWRGAIFPFELLPKIASDTNPYKRYVSEFMSLRFLGHGLAAGGPGFPYFHGLYFLLLVLPISFLAPAVWRQVRRSQASAFSRNATGYPGLLAATFWAACIVVSLPGTKLSRWFLPVGQWAPVVMLAGGITITLSLASSSRRASLMALVGTAAWTTWAIWLRSNLIGLEGSPTAWPAFGGRPEWTWLMGGLGLMAIALTIGAGARPSRVFTCVAFGALAMQAIRNIPLLALAGGSIAAWNVGEWLDQIKAEQAAAEEGSHRASQAVPTTRFRLIRQTIFPALLVLLFLTIVSDRFYVMAGVPRRFGLREQPLVYAHGAARFASGAGLPEKALVYDMLQAGVYLFHNAPARKPFMDSRLEVPSLATFLTYARVEQSLDQGRSDWAADVRRMGDPLILLDHHHSGGEATLMLHPRWRCVYYDAVASVFLPISRADLWRSYPSVDFLVRHFRNTPPSPDRARAYLAEAAALSDLGEAMRRLAPASDAASVPVCLLGAARARRALASTPNDASCWKSLGKCYNGLALSLLMLLAGDEDEFDPAVVIPFAQAAYCRHRAFELDREQSLRAGPPLSSFGNEPNSVSRSNGSVTEKERTALQLLYRGEPATARRLYNEATELSSQPVRLTHIAMTYMAENELATAVRQYKGALSRDPRLGEAWFGLAFANLEMGEAAGVVNACREGLKCRLTERQRSFLSLAQRLADSQVVDGEVP